MTIDNREASIKETLKWEGAYSNHPDDKGGPTMYGITIYDARKYWKKHASADDVRSMPLDIAVDIYRSKYWKTPYYDCDKLAKGVDLAVFDFGVNSGPSRARKFQDRTVGGTDQETIRRLCDSRLEWLQTLSNWPSFGTGWTRRVKGIKSKALSMSTEPQKAEKGSAAGIMTLAAAAAAFFEAHAPIILIGGAFTAIFVWGLIRWYKNEKAKIKTSETLRKSRKKSK